MSSKYAFAAACVLIAACSRTALIGDPDEIAPELDAGADVTGVDARVDEPDAEPTDASKPAPRCAVADAGSPPYPDACGQPLRVVSLTPSSPSCFLDLAITPSSAGAITVFCKGGYASADFGKGQFQGNFEMGVVDVCIGTTYVFSDGCTWASAQRITGVLASGTLTFDYSEAPTQGTNCASPCTATGVLTTN
jgi:hypothetical protein